MRMSVGVDLHKGQFTVYWRTQGVSDGRNARYGELMNTGIDDLSGNSLRRLREATE